MHYLRYILLIPIKIYQKTLSPDHGLLSYFIPYGACKFRPTCSEYGFEAIKKYGIFKGGFLSTKRILRCHPWSQGGYDPVPSQNNQPLRRTGKMTK